jgi:hypothetical protein
MASQHDRGAIADPSADAVLLSFGSQRDECGCTGKESE